MHLAYFRCLEAYIMAEKIFIRLIIMFSYICIKSMVKLLHNGSDT